MKIRTGGFMQDGVLTPEFYELLDEYDNRFREAARNTALPDEPDRERISALVEQVNRKAVLE